uniref:Protein kinase domain-containing protein n=1 Tax=Aplanochytrium stocchinoi TaxID=215587 RepID=A0A7S3PNF6_9STRA|mmetsp:Transcript_13067/g.16962  ORF Transcript_13067/g.16962 Transcript_13067/m.16962 type:complete len:458 (-) Transcript_13067:213-1586(-)
MGIGISSIRKYKLKNASVKRNLVEWVADPIRDGRYLRDKVVKFEDFEKICYLNSGQSSNVYLCKYKRNGKYYALKAVKKYWVYDERQFDHVQREMSVHLGLTQGAANLFRVFENHSYIYFVMEYCVLGDLKLLLLRNGRFPRQVLQYIIAGIVNGINYLHETRCIIHRHICASNVMLSATGHVKLIDFGNARSVSREQTHIKTVDKDVLGSFEYAAPELIPPSMKEILYEYKDTETHHSFPVDYWALGVLLFYMASRKFPYGKQENRHLSAQSVAKRVLEGKRKRLPLHISFYYRSSGLIELINGLLDPNPTTRWSCEEIKSCRFMASTNIDKHQNMNPPYLPKRRLVSGDSSSFGKLHRRAEPKDSRVLLTEEEFGYTYFTKIIEKEMHKISLVSPRPKTCDPVLNSLLTEQQNGDISEFGDDIRPEEWFKNATLHLEAKKKNLSKRLRSKVVPGE